LLFSAQEAKKISNLESIREKLLSSLDQYAKLLAGDTTFAEPDEALIQQLTAAVGAEKEQTAAVGAEKEQVTEGGRISTSAQPLAQANTGENLASFFTSPVSESEKSIPFGNDPFSTGE
uniref:Type VI secretion system membrane subunit TssM n=1 Tax=Hydatigena taeniaeformis TaxID=6205 RepID=A0A0R3XDJ9_HYDTA